MINNIVPYLERRRDMNIWGDFYYVGKFYSDEIRLATLVIDNYLSVRTNKYLYCRHRELQWSADGKAVFVIEPMDDRFYENYWLAWAHFQRLQHEQAA